MRESFASLSAALFSVILLSSHVAWAQGPEPPDSSVVVVDVTGPLDAARVRAGVGRELHVVAVAPDDARAAKATGRVSIGAQSEEHALVVSYREVGAPVTRRAELPTDPVRAENTAILLAGNVARDEARELASAREKVAAMQVAPPPDAQAKAKAKAIESRGELARMRAVLSSTAEDERSTRLAVGWTTTSISAAVAAAGVYLMAFSVPDLPPSSGVSIVATPGPNGALPLIVTSCPGAVFVDQDPERAAGEVLLVGITIGG